MITCIIDTREQMLNKFFHENDKYKDIIFKSSMLDIGDIHIYIDQDLKYIIERKTTIDLSASIKDGRYKEQKNRLKNQSAHVIYIIEGEINTLFPKMKINGILTTTLQTCLIQLSLIDRFSVISTSDAYNTCIVLGKILKKYTDFDVDTEKSLEQKQIEAIIIQNSKKKKTYKTCYLSILSQIPGISVKKATAISSYYPSIFNLIESYMQCKHPGNMLQDIMICKRKLGPILSNRVYNVLLNK